MNNQQILKKRWNKVDKALLIYLKEYNKINKITQDNIQNVFNGIDFGFKDLYNYADRETKAKINRLIGTWEDEGLLTGDFKTMAINIRDRKRVKNSEILELMLLSCYVIQQSRVNIVEEELFKNLSDYEYRQAQLEVYEKQKKKIKPISITDILLLSLLAIPNERGYVWEDNKENVLKANANQVYRQMIVNLQQARNLRANEELFQKMFRTQNNKYLCYNNGIFSGSLNSQVSCVVNKSVELGYFEVDKKAKARFIAELDSETTLMCETLDNRVFYINDWNTFDRYSAIDDRNVVYKVFGLQIGLNLPPISNHIHKCRSTITYQTDINIGILRDILHGNVKFEEDIDDVLKNYKNNDVEHLVFYDIETGKQIGKTITGDRNTVEIPISTNLQLSTRKKGSVITFHNHPSNSTFSSQDLLMFNNRKELGMMGIVTDKYVYVLNKNNRDKIKMSSKEETIFKNWYKDAKNKYVKTSNKEKTEAMYEFDKEVLTKIGWKVERIEK